MLVLPELNALSGLWPEELIVEADVRDMPGIWVSADHQVPSISSSSSAFHMRFCRLTQAPPCLLLLVCQTSVSIALCLVSRLQTCTAHQHTCEDCLVGTLLPSITFALVHNLMYSKFNRRFDWT